MPSPLPTSPLPAPRPKLGQIEFVSLMAMVQALQALAVDSMLPALGRMSADLGVTEPNQRQLIIGLFLISIGVGSLVPGTLADRFGRRRVLLACLSSYIIFTAACALATSFTALLAARVALGLFSSGLMVLPSAIIRDMYSGDRMARLQSSVGMVFMIVPMIAPSVGQAVLLVAGWRWIFGVMGLMGLIVATWVALRLPETMAPDMRRPIAPRAIAVAMLTVVTHRRASGYVFGMALIQGALFGYINSSQQLVAEHFGAGARFPLLFAGMAAMMAVTNFTNSRIVERLGARTVSHTALLASVITAFAQVALARSGHETLWSFAPLMALNLCLMSFIGANFASMALQPFARIAGSAASAQAFLRMVLASALGALVGHMYDGTARPLAMALVCAGVATLGLVLFSERGRLYRPRVTLR